MKYTLLLLLLPFLAGAQDDIYPENKTYTHDEVILKYASLEKEHPGHCRLIKYGKTDCGRNLHLFLINKEGEFNPKIVDRDMNIMILINNAIHPGEPCGVDACVKMSREILKNPDLIPDHVIIGIIPMYNIGGGTNRNCCSRANQNGPEEYGFRGNARNLDLNRDFIKMDSRNARSFVEMYQDWQPEIFVDTHTSNGADYQHVMTLITSQTDKLNPILSSYVVDKMRPHLFKKMEKAGYPMVPYMHGMGKKPEDGIMDYLETPRYSTGYSAAFNAIGFVTEAHMLKPYKDRVESTYEFLKILSDFAEKNWQEIHSNKRLADQNDALAKTFTFNYKLDTTRFQMIKFKGYKAIYKPSEVTGEDRLFYDRNQPYTTEIKYYRYYKPTDTLSKPKYYVVPQAWGETVKRLKANGVIMQPVQFDTTIEASAYYIQNYETVTSPYEGHYLHYNTTCDKREVAVKLYHGDFLIEMGTAKDRFIMGVLEPTAVDSYFAWNFFDGILMQKEWFSAYVFEDKAAEMLKNDAALKKEFEQKKAEDSEFANNARAQLYYLYLKSPHYESSHMRYPVYRIE